mgnify:CR=1 FL=1
MEAYRACEKDSKNKSYSKEGIVIKPEDKRKVKLRNWIQKCLDDLKAQLEQIDSEAEVLKIKVWLMEDGRVFYDWDDVDGICFREHVEISLTVYGLVPV